MKTKVAVTLCPRYEKSSVREAVWKAADLAGGLSSFVKPGDRVFVKVNHLSPTAPREKAVITHPLFTGEVLRLLKDCGAAVTVGDDVSDGGGDGFAGSGLREVCRSVGAPLINLRSAGFREVPCPPGGVLKTAFISAAALDADVIVNLPKLKTHSLTAYTGAVKNMYGLVPYGQRLALHCRFPKNAVFSRMLVDVFGSARPRLTIMDAVVAMEGPGPSAGSPRSLGLVIAGGDAVAVDAVAQVVTGFGPADVVTTVEASRRGLGISDAASLEVLGTPLKDVTLRNFKKATIPVSVLERGIPAALYGFISGQLVLVPEIAAAACTGCGECARVCPRGAVAWKPGGGARILKPACIQCLCCHEVCPSNAIRVGPRPVGRVIRFLRHVFRKR